MIKKYLLLLIIAISFSANSADAKFKDHSPSKEETVEVYTNAYLYFHSLVYMDMTKYYTLPTTTNKWMHKRSIIVGDFDKVIRMNFDILYSASWIDLTKGPVAVTIDSIPKRFFMFQFIDMWSDTFAVISNNTIQKGRLKWVFHTQEQNVEKYIKQGFTPINSPTDIVWVGGRTWTSGSEDYAMANKVQDTYHIYPLEGGILSPQEKSSDKFRAKKTGLPPAVINAMPAKDYFRYAFELLEYFPEHYTDTSIKEKMIRTGLTLDNLKSNKVDNSHMELAKGKAQDILDDLDKPENQALVNGWFLNKGSIGVYGNEYNRRAYIARIGIGANPPEYGAYPLLKTDADGQLPQADKNYVMHFNKGQNPPAYGFWAITVYDENGFTKKNTKGKYTIGDRTPFKYNEDGSLDIYIGKDAPKGFEKNWLPTTQYANRNINVVMRLYVAKQSYLLGKWNPPALNVID